METIRDYLDAMFVRLPQTDEVKKAKEELWQMMEDKYGDLRAEGVEERAAAGIVIAEFGNLEEFSQALGVQDLMKGSEQIVSLSLETAQEYLAERKKYAFRIALGVALCILSVVAPMVGDSFGDSIIGTALMFVMIAIAVILFIYAANVMSKWKHIEEEPCMLHKDALEYVKEQMGAFTPNYALLLGIGVAFCILSVVPSMVFDEIHPLSDYAVQLENLGGGLLFVLVAIGVFIIVLVANTKAGFEKLLEADGRKERVDSEKKEIQYRSPAVAFVMSVYWPTITCIYLSYSFLTFNWHFSWIIWIIAGVLHEGLKAAFTQAE